MAGRIRAIRVLAGQVLDEVDVLSHTVHPRVLNDLGLLAGLRHLARTVGDSLHPVEVVVSEGSEDAFCGLGMETAAVLYRVAQDAIQNAKRHSNARSTQIILGATSHDISMQVVDNGVGFDVTEARARRPGMGLFTMSERVGLVHGEFAVESAPGKGTKVRVRIPVERSSTLPNTAGSVK
jgi:signal transduction histidine kinase